MDDRELQEIFERLRIITEEVAEANQKGVKVSSETYAEMEKLKKKIKDASESGDKLKKSFNNLGSASADLAAAMYRGEQGASVFAGTVESMAAAISAAISLIPGIGIAAKVAAVAVAGLAKAANLAAEQGDTLYNSYVDLAKSGAATAGGLEAVFQNLQKFGMGIEQLDQFTQMIANNRQELSKLGLTVGDATEQLADISAGLLSTGLRREFMMLGYTVPEINEAMVDYIALQSQVGMTQNRSTRQLTNSSEEYLKTVDALTRATGIQRDQIEDNIRSARTEQQFRARMDRMRQEDPERAADIERMFGVLAERAPETAQALRGMTSGMVATEKAAKLQAVTGGRALQMVNAMMQGTTEPIEFLQEFAETAGGASENFGMLAEANAFDRAFGPFYEFANLGVDAQKDLLESYREAVRNQSDTTDEQGSILDRQVGMRISQMDARDALQAMVQDGVAPATAAMEGLAGITNSVINLLDAIPGVGREEGRQAKNAEFLKGTNVTDGRETADEFSQAVGGLGISGGIPGPTPDSKVSQVVAGLVSELKGSSGITAAELFASPNDPAGKTAERIVRNLSNIELDTDLSQYINREKPDTKILSALAQQYLGLLQHDEPGAGRQYREEVAAAIARELGMDPKDVDSFRKGGVATGPTSGYLAELHGTEAIVPLNSGSIPVTISNLNSQLSEVFYGLGNMISDATGNDPFSAENISKLSISTAITSLESAISSPMQQLVSQMAATEAAITEQKTTQSSEQVPTETIESSRSRTEQTQVLRDQIVRLDRLIQVSQSNNNIMSKILQNSYG